MGTWELTRSPGNTNWETKPLAGIHFSMHFRMLTHGTECNFLTLCQWHAWGWILDEPPRVASVPHASDELTN
jgi:hypothetical protein